jgi:hypothetical protein
MPLEPQIAQLGLQSPFDQPKGGKAIYTTAQVLGPGVSKFWPKGLNSVVTPYVQLTLGNP